ncbi:response regulator [Dactylosporangium sp. CS-033363]|uniref:response regulator n=1 Tax=Dactylosporangium sp. CS-033363 TaxID=3239935 RepID=UPI003D8C5E8F
MIEHIRVVVVDDEALIRGGLRLLIGREPDLELVGEAGDGAAAISVIEATRPDVVLLDLRMPGLDGLAVLNKIRSDANETRSSANETRSSGGETRNGAKETQSSAGEIQGGADEIRSGPRVVVVTTFETDENVFAALQAGAAGFILKDAEPAELIRAIRVVASGEALLSPSVTRRVIARFGRDSGPPVDLDRLTEREREVAAWVATGRSNDEIAAELDVSPATVRTHVGRAMLKVNARDRAQLAVMAIRAGLSVQH